MHLEKRYNVPGPMNRRADKVKGLRVNANGGPRYVSARAGFAGLRSVLGPAEALKVDGKRHARSDGARSFCTGGAAARGGAKQRRYIEDLIRPILSI